MNTSIRTSQELNDAIEHVESLVAKYVRHYNATLDRERRAFYLARITQFKGSLASLQAAKKYGGAQ